MLTSQRPVHILLVEDDDVDAFLIRKYLQHIGDHLSLYHVTDAETAVKVLTRAPAYENVPKPDLLLLDMNLPRVSGIHVLEAMKADPALSGIPVVIISGLDLKKEPLMQRYDLVENSIIRKWVSMKDFASIVKAVEDCLNERRG